MTNEDKEELRQLAEEGWTYEKIRSYVECSNATIRNYIRVFKPKKGKERE